MSDFNSIDISEPTCAFTNKEWTALGTGGGQTHITEQRMMINGRGRGRDAGKSGRGRGIAAVETGAEQKHVNDSTGREGRGGRNGVSFGRGGYRA